MAYAEIPYWKLFLLYRLLEHATTIVRVLDPDFDDRSMLEWMTESEVFESPLQAQWAMHRLGDLMLSSGRSKEKVEFAYEEVEILKAALKIAAEMVYNPIGEIDEKYVRSATSHTLRDTCNALKSLSEHILLYSSKVESIINDVEQE